MRMKTLSAKCDQQQDQDKHAEVCTNAVHVSRCYLEEIPSCAAELGNNVDQGGGGWIHGIRLQDQKGVYFSRWSGERASERSIHSS